MKRALILFSVIISLSSGSAHAAGAGLEPAVRRFAILVGSNSGGEARAALHYARSDASAMSQLLVTLGGVAPQDQYLLQDPTAVELRRALENVRQRLEGLKGFNIRRELIFYYSGHSDEQALLLGEERLSYLSLHQLLMGLPADFQVAILDSCASGAFTRLKGGALIAPFLVDQSSHVKGHAILTSSSEGEPSQESDSVGGSFFTHHLLSGLRGAADLSHDGKITLNEAYQFAFHETLARTERTQAGAQHPAYDIEVAGSGDVVMTDLRTTQATLVLPATLEGRLFIRDVHGTLVVEMEKLPRVPVELGLDEGAYTATLNSPGETREGSVTLRRGEKLTLVSGMLHVVAQEPTVSRGDVRTHLGPSTVPGTLVFSAFGGAGLASGAYGGLFMGSVDYRLFRHFSLGLLLMDMPNVVKPPQTGPGFTVIGPVQLDESGGRLALMLVGTAILHPGPFEVDFGVDLGLVSFLPLNLGLSAVGLGGNVTFGYPLTDFLDVVARGEAVYTFQEGMTAGPYALLSLGLRVRLLP